MLKMMHFVESCLSSSAENRNAWVSRRTGLGKERGFEGPYGGTGGYLLQSFGKTSMSPKSSESTPLQASYIITAIFPFKEKNLESKPTSVDFSGFRQMLLGSEAQLCQMEEHSSSYSPPRTLHLDHSPRMSKDQDVS